MALGPLERPASELYRSVFIDLDACARHIGSGVTPRRILEIGCGDGFLTERLARRHPSASISAIDISPSPGRQFRGDRSRVEFASQPAQDFVRNRDGRYDLVVLCDVLHHVPRSARLDILEAASRAVTAGGRFVLKEWVRTGTPIDRLAYQLETRLSGAFTRYETTEYWRDLLAEVFGASARVEEHALRPWRNNHLFSVQTALRAA